MHALRWHLEGMAESAHLELGKGMRRYSPCGGGRLHLRWHPILLWCITLISQCSNVLRTHIRDHRPPEKIVDAPALLLPCLMRHLLVTFSDRSPCNSLPPSTRALLAILGHIKVKLAGRTHYSLVLSGIQQVELCFVVIQIDFLQVPQCHIRFRLCSKEGV